ncbi:MAG: hypothetical protein ACTSPY_08805 [Candidatus Helarchaeota archaeon]
MKYLYKIYEVCERGGYCDEKGEVEITGERYKIGIESGESERNKC